MAQPLELGLAILGIALGVAVVTSVDIARVSADLYITTPGSDATASSWIAPSGIARND